MIQGEFADGSKLLAVPKYARANRESGLPPEAGPMAADPSLFLGANARPPAASPPVERRALPLASIVWITEA